MNTQTTLEIAKVELILAVILGTILWLIDLFVSGPWWLLIGFVVWTLTRYFDRIVGWPRLMKKEGTNE